MTSNKPASAGVVGAGLGKGCLAGIGLAVGFFAISGLVYLLLGPFGLAQNIRLLVAIASGPVLGTAAVVIAFLNLSRRAQQMANPRDETAPWDSP